MSGPGHASGAAGASVPAPSGRAESLAVAADYLTDAVGGLEGAARVLDRAGVLGAADKAQALCARATDLHAEVRGAARAAHRAERPEVYDEAGRWIGNHDKHDNGKEQD